MGVPVTVEERLVKLLEGKLAPYLRLLSISDPELYKLIIKRLKQR